MIHQQILVFILSLAIVASFPEYYCNVGGKSDCTKAVTPGATIASHGKIATTTSTAGILTITRGSTALTSGATYNAGESLSFSVTAPSGNYVFITTTGATFPGGYCTGKNRLYADTTTLSGTITMPSTGTVQVWILWSNSGSAVITPSPYFVLNPPILPTLAPVFSPTLQPLNPSYLPTRIPTTAPSSLPSFRPTSTPTTSPSISPSLIPSTSPTVVPTIVPTFQPSMIPSIKPSLSPTSEPSFVPSIAPSSMPLLPGHTFSPSTVLPTGQPTTFKPTVVPSTVKPSFKPTSIPSQTPSRNPSIIPSTFPSLVPTSSPTKSPTQNPTSTPSSLPSFIPSSEPTYTPSFTPTNLPTIKRTHVPSAEPTVEPTTESTMHPTSQPTTKPLKVISTSTPSAIIKSVISNNQQVSSYAAALYGGSIGGVVFIGIIMCFLIRRFDRQNAPNAAYSKAGNGEDSHTMYNQTAAMNEGDFNDETSPMTREDKTSLDRTESYIVRDNKLFFHNQELNHEII